VKSGLKWLPLPTFKKSGFLQEKAHNKQDAHVSKEKDFIYR
jgi:hypothetical protein